MCSEILVLPFSLAFYLAATAGMLVAQQVGHAVQIPEVQPNGAPKPPSPIEQFRAIKAEWDDYERAWRASIQRATTDSEKAKLSSEMSAKTARYASRFNTLAEAHPTDPGGREALIWVLQRCRSRLDRFPPWSTEAWRAYDLVVEHYADDVEIIRSTIPLAGAASRPRDRLFRGLEERSTKPEARGLACLALADSLVTRAALVETAARYETPPIPRIASNDARGRPSFKPGTVPMTDPAYWQELRMTDASALRTEANALYQRVVRDYANLPGPKDTLGQTALSRLDALNIVVLGKPAPAIEGLDLDGKPMKLSDFRGKVVVIAFFNQWGTGNRVGLPVVRDLAEKYKDKPVVILGVLADPVRAVASDIMAEQDNTWRNWFDPTGSNKAIRDRYHLPLLPALAVVDANGTLRYKNHFAASPVGVIDELLIAMEAEAKTKSVGP